MATQFTFETVDGPDSVRGQSSLAFDKDGIPRIAYVDVSGRVRLASRASGAWTIEKILGTGIVDPSDEDRVCLEIDSLGNPQIAFLDGTNHLLIYGVKLHNDWTFTTVPTHFRDARSVINFSFKLHPGRLTPELRDTPHFAYKDMSGPNLGYTRMFRGRLEATTVDDREAENEAADDTGAFDDGLHTSLTFEVLSEELRIAYFDQKNLHSGFPVQRLCLARILDVEANIISRTTAILSVLDGDDILGTCSSLATTMGGGIHIAYVDLSNHILKAFVKDFDLPEPRKETVATGVTRTVPSAADKGGEFVIAYGDDNKLKLASRDKFGEWSVEVVDPSGGAMPSLAFDKFGNAHIAYTVGRALKYARGSAALPPSQ
jgi:hypothetical protein